MGALLLLGACGPVEGARSGDPPGDAEAPLLVLAAADLQYALPAIVRLHERATGRRVAVVLGSTGNLAAQIENGAPGDVFLAANEAFLDRLEAAGRVRPGSRRVYAVGRLALTWAPGTSPPAGLADLARPEYREVAIAHPEHAPYGAAARQALVAVGAWDALRPRLVHGENVAQAFQFVRTGNARAGLVALGVALGVPGTPYHVVDDALHAPLRQAGAVLAGAPRAEEASAFLDLLASPEGLAVLARYGFEDPDP